MLSEFEHAPEYVDSDYPTNDPDTGQNCCAPQECGEQSSGSPLDFDEPQPEEFSSICRRFSGCATVESSALERSAPMCVSSPSNYDISCAGGMKEGSLVFERNPGLAESKATSTRTDDPNQATDTDRYDFEFGSMNPTNGHKSSRSLNDITTNQNGGPPRPQRRLSRDKNGPSLAHRMRHNTSILALAVSPDRIFAGTQKGQILIYSIDTFERLGILYAHNSSVLALHLSHDRRLLFSSAGDRIVNIWDTSTFQRVYSLYSSFDIGDIFCVAYSPSLRTVYLGAQNTSIQWYDLNRKDSKTRPSPTAHPSFHRFFDSLGPGGTRTPPPQDQEGYARHAVGGQSFQIPKANLQQFAHFGYVYCMTLTRNLLLENSREVLISGGGDGIIKIWKVDDRNGGAISELFVLEDGREEGESVLTIAVDGSFLYSGRTDGEINVWDLETKQLVRSLKAHVGDVLTVSVGGGFLFSAGLDGEIEKFDRRYESVSRYRAHEGRILASAFIDHKDRKLFVTGGNDHSIAVWDIADCADTPIELRRTSYEQLSESLKRFISYRTVSSDPRYKPDCHRGASFLRSVLKNFGARTEMLATQESLNPIILAKFRGNPPKSETKRKVLFYGHYDVVAAENERGKWIADPFSMEGIDGYFYGRGVSDNKGPIMAAVYAVAELVAEKSLNSDITFIIEGEEECGSRGFADAILKHKHLIGDVDWILLANSYWLDDHVPCLTYGLRGVIHATVQVESQHPDLHSGVDGSALLDESLKDLVMLLAKLTGKNGHVEIPGFYDPILPLTDDEQALYDEITFALLQRNPDLGDPKALAASLMRRWREASLTIHRFQTSGPENSTIIPRLARAALSMRLVPNQGAGIVANSLIKVLQSEFDKLESKNRLTVTIDHQAEPWLGDHNNEIFQTLERAIMHVWGPIQPRRRSSLVMRKPVAALRRHSRDAKAAPATSSTLANGSVTPPNEKVTSPIDEVEDPRPKGRKPLYIREGGSIPAIRFLEKEFDAPAAHLPCGQASDSAHLNNERLRVLNLYKSKDIFKMVFREFPG